MTCENHREAVANAALAALKGAEATGSDHEAELARELMEIVKRWKEGRSNG